MAILKPSTIGLNRNISNGKLLEVGNAFSVDNGGNTIVAGELNVNDDKFKVDNSGNTTVSGEFNVNGKLSVDSDGTEITGTLNVNDKFKVDNSGNTTVSGEFNVNGKLSVDSDGTLNVNDKFKVDNSGNTTVSGEFNVNGKLSVDSDGTEITGTLDSTGIVTAPEFVGITNANTAKFAEDTMSITEPFGKYQPNGGTIELSGLRNMSIEEFIRDALTIDVTTGLILVNPSASISLSTAGTYEPGATVTITYTTNFNDGKYKYDPGENTGVTLTSGVVSDSSGTISSSGSKSITVSDSTEYRLTYTYAYSQGSIPKSLLGKPVEGQRIAAGSNKKAYSQSIVGKRRIFYGVADSIPTTSASIRSLNSKKWVGETTEFEVTANAGNKTIAWALPSSMGKTPSFEYFISNEWKPLSGVSSKTVISVDGASGNAVNYDMYSYTPSAGSFAATTRCKMKI